ncbi:Lysosomal acid phosphatase [Orchesella cincta]|uniref:acid phosphatase n=1 Tax=Orchesella cincta TaxID=48709 RepID=A0A1D2NKZ1_ORCCI|nr:Lysosomal acid phosphatase [Orchesella cincta]
MKTNFLARFRILVTLLLCLCVGFSTSQNQTSEVNHETLKLVQLIIRHGDRVPEYPYPNDPFSDPSTWPEGWAQITDEGKRQEYQLGQYLRTRYGNYLNSSYVPNQIYAVSSDTDRTIMSGMMALAGLYPTNNETNWNSTVNWQPVPLRTIFTDDDNLIRFKRKCPKFDELFDDFIHNSPMMKKINEDNKELYANLSANSGVNITTINEIDSFYATLFVEEFKGLDIPEWGRPLKTDEHFQYLYNLSFQAKTYTPELQRLRTGPLVKYLTDNVNERVHNASLKTKMFFLSGHDITLVDILNTFGVFDLHRPTYASVFILELHQDPNTEKFFVEFFLRNDTTREPYKLTMPGCEFQCPLESFQNYTKRIIPNNWAAECQLTVPAIIEESSVFTYTIIVVGVVALVVFLIGLGCMMLQKKRRIVQQQEYQTF